MRFMKPRGSTVLPMAARRCRWLPWRGLVSLGFACSSLACFGPKSERLSCDDVGGASAADFRVIQSLVLDPEKGCLAPQCHSGEGQPKGLRLDDPDLVYEEMSTRPDLFYAYLSSGEMPDKGTPWSDEDLKAFRTWYCNGAFPP